MTNQTKVNFTLDGKPCVAESGESILTVAKRNGVEIPNLCFHPKQDAEANCRSCVVEIEGERVLAPSCRRTPAEGMVIHSHNERARNAQKGVISLLQSNVDAHSLAEGNDLSQWAEHLGLDQAENPFAENIMRHKDTSHPAFQFDASACIVCTRCVRACSEVQVNEVIGLASRGGETRIEFDLDTAIGNSTCVSCGECVQACPTGALINKTDVASIEISVKVETKKTDSVCPYCGVGCQLTYHTQDNKIVKVEGRDGPANFSRLCVKGRYGFDYIHHPERLTQPMLRIEGAAKGMNEYFDPADPSKMFRPVSWQEALKAAADGLNNILEQHGDESLAGFGSAKGSNEEAYLFQKIVRTGFRNNNIDHCTRLCHASSVAALLEGIGSGAVSNPVEDVKHADLIFIIGSNITGNHPVAATFVKNAHKSGAKLVVLDPRKIDISRHADHFLQFKPDSDVALINAMLHTIIEEDLLDHDFIANRTNNFEEVKANVAKYSPEAMQDICGIDAKTIRQVAREYATANNSIIFWGMGVSQHIHGTDNVRCLISLCMLTGQIGRRGTGLHPLRGQNNVQGASDAGLIPMMYPDYQRVDNPEFHTKYQHVWDTALSTKPGLTVVEIMHAIDAGTIKGMYMMGENPAMSDPNLNQVRHALASLEHLVVQDIFLTETAAFADVILPATAWPEKDGSVTNTDRCVQRGRKAVDAPGEAMPDAWIIQEMAKQLELDWPEQTIGEVFEEMRSVMPSLSGISWDRLTENDAVTYPCKDADDPGQQVVFVENFPTPDGKAKLVPAKLIKADELPDSEYPFILMTGRKLEHWHTGSMTRRADVLAQIEPTAAIDMNPADISKLGYANGDMVTVQSRRGEIKVEVNSSLQVQAGEVFMPFCFNEAAVNLLTNEAIDPYGKIPEFKYCAVSIQ